MSSTDAASSSRIGQGRSSANGRICCAQPRGESHDSQPGSAGSVPSGEGTMVGDLPADTLGALLTLVTQRHGPRLGSVLNRCSVLVDGVLTEDRATEVNDDIARRRAALEEAPQATKPPTVFVFDSGTKQIFTSGSFGAPQAIIEAAGAKNATADVKDTWTEVSWEQLVSSDPDFFAFVDYEGQSFEDKVKVLESNPATRDLPAVKEKRFLNLPIPAWTSSPLNINSAEQLRVALEEHDLVPESDIEPEHDLQPTTSKK